MRQVLLTLLISTPALAHDPLIPLLQCRHEAAEVTCTASWSTGVAMSRARYEVTDAQDKTLLSGQTDRQGRLRFVLPQGEFYVLIWDARNMLAEVGWRDVKENH